MAMLRVSSYRKLFEDDSWRRNGGLSVRCAGQYQASVRSVWVLLTTFKILRCTNMSTSLSVRGMAF